MSDRRSKTALRKRIAQLVKIRDQGFRDIEMLQNDRLAMTRDIERLADEKAVLARMDRDFRKMESQLESHIERLTIGREQLKTADLDLKAANCQITRLEVDKRNEKRKTDGLVSAWASINRIVDEPLHANLGRSMGKTLGIVFDLVQRARETKC